jgi:hypothetical protein
MRVNPGARRTEDAGTGILALCALICAFAVFALHIREQKNTTPAVFSSVQLSFAKSVSDKRARIVDVAPPANDEPSVPTGMDITTGASGADVRGGAAKKIARRVTGPSRTYRAYGVPY